MIRKPAVAGQFYPAEKERLLDEIQTYTEPDAVRVDCLGVVAPHAGYIYSGKVAGAVYSRVKKRKSVIILGVNHRGFGKPFAIMKTGSWETPLGIVPIDTELANLLASSSRYLVEDPLAHQFEHSLEVQIPFLQVHFGEDFKIVPIAMKETRLEDYKGLGKEIASKIQDSGQILIVASTDMTHYEPQKEAEKKDKEAISSILRLDENGLFNKVKGLNISMCGCVPTIVMLVATKALGAKEAELVSYMTSGDITKDYYQVVGYAGIIIR